MTDIEFTALEFWVSLDQDDPDIIAGLTIGAWEKSEPGKWLLEHSDISWRRVNNPDSISLHYKIVSTITPEKYTFWSLTYK
jgi:hypothetical protein